MATETTNQNKVTTETVPQTWPGAFGVYKHSKEVVLTNWQVLVGLIAISFGLGLLLGTVQLPFDIRLEAGAAKTGVAAIFELISWIVSFIIGACTIIALLGGTEKKDVSLTESFTKAKPNLLKYFVGMILMYAVMFASFIAFIIPFFFVAPRVVLTSYYILDKGMDPLDALRASWNDTKGNVGKLYGMVGACIVFILPMLTIILIPLSIYWLFMYQAAPTVLYRYITGQTKSAA